MAKKNRKTKKQVSKEQRVKTTIRISLSLVLGGYNKVLFLNLSLLTFLPLLLWIAHPNLKVWNAAIFESNFKLFLVATNALLFVVAAYFVKYLEIPEEIQRRIVSSVLVAFLLIGTSIGVHAKLNSYEAEIFDECYQYNQAELVDIIGDDDALVSVLVAKFDFATDEKNPQSEWLSVLVDIANDDQTIKVSKYQETLDSTKMARKAVECLGYNIVIFGRDSSSDSISSRVNTIFVFNLSENSFLSKVLTQEFEGNQYVLTRAQLGEIQTDAEIGGRYAIHFMNAVLSLHEEDVEDALFQINQAIMNAPQSVDQQKRLGLHALRTLKAELLIALYGYDYIEVQEELNNAHRIDSSYFYAYIVQGRLQLYGDRDPEAALDTINQAILLDPSSAEAYNLKGIILDQLEDTDGAMENFSISLGLDNTSVLASNAYANRASLFFEKGLHQNAISDSLRAIELNPERADFYNLLGFNYALLGEDYYEEAITYFNIAISKDPNLFLAYYNLGVAYAKMNLINPAIANFDQAILINPDFARSYYNRGVVYDWIGENEKALSDYYMSRSLGYSDNQLENRILELESIVN